MTVSTKTLTLAETFFQPEVNLEIGVKSLNPVTLLAIFNANKVSINQSCGGNGTCGTCRVEILHNSDLIQPPSEYEREAIQELTLKSSERLSCQTEINLSSKENNLRVKIVNEPVD